MATGRRRGRVIIYIALILILLLVLLLVLTRFNPLGGGGGTTANNAPAAQTTPQVAPTQVSDVINIVVNTQDIQRGQPLTDDLLALVAIPRSQYTQGVFYTDKKDLANTRAKYDLKAHTPLTNALVVNSDSTGSIPSFDIPAGKVAISIPVSRLSAVSYGLQKGDHVNVLVSLLLADLDTSFQSVTPNRTGLVIAPGPVGGSSSGTSSQGSQGSTSITAQLFQPPEYTITAPTAASLMGRIEIDPTLNNPVWVIPSEKQRPRLVSQTLIQDVVVLQMGNFNQPSASQTGQAAAAQPTARPQPTQQVQQQQQQAQQAAAAALPDVATLIVSP
ncbi:MAG TPA: SAF domain-containing protein, partial [Anaerolineaceae bacterium]